MRMGRLSLRLRMALTINGFIVLSLFLLIVLLTRQTYEFAREQAFTNCRETAHRYVSEVRATMNNALLITRTLEQTLEGLKLAWVNDRSLYNSMLSQVLRANPGLVGVWSAWEPDALDGNDATFSGKSGHDKTGRFIPSWVRVADDVELDKLTDYDKAGAGDYYLLARNSGMEMLLEPRPVKVAGKETRVVTVASPIRYNGAVVGVVGVDMPVQNIQSIVASIRPYGTGWARLIASSGRVIAHADRTQAGELLQDSFTKGLVEKAIASGKTSAGTVFSPSLKADVYEIVVPVDAGDIKAGWALAVSLPLDRVMAEARRVMFRIILIGGLTVLVMVGVVAGLARSLSMPLKHVADGLSSASAQLESVSKQTQSASQSLAEGASEQAASLETTSASLEQMSAMTESDAQTAVAADGVAKATAKMADQGVEAMANMQAAIARIRSSAVETAKIIKTIDEIAFQTNLLALNAAVEAARAGEAGKGFAVVAMEVRNLARRSADAARTTAELIESSQQNAEQGVKVTEEVARSLASIRGNAGKVAKLIEETAESAREQAKGIDQVSKSVMELDKVVQENVSNAEESSSASEELSAQAQELNSMVTELVGLVDGTSS